MNVIYVIVGFLFATLVFSIISKIKDANKTVSYKDKTFNSFPSKLHSKLTAEQLVNDSKKASLVSAFWYTILIAVLCSGLYLIVGNL